MMNSKEPNARMIGISLGMYILSVIFKFYNEQIFDFADIGKMVLVIAVIKVLDFLLDGIIRSGSVNLGFKNFFRLMGSMSFIYFGVMLNIHLLKQFIPYLETFFNM